MSTTHHPAISVVIASIVGAPFIDDCLDSLELQAGKCGAEVIVVACGTAEYAARIADKYPWVRVIHRAERGTVPDLRRHGVESSSGEIVAIIEEHCVAAADWLEQALKAFASGDFGVVGGPIAPNGYARLRDWVMYFCEYNNCLPPWQEGGAHGLGTASSAYSRALLLQYTEEMKAGFWESGLYPRLLADGVRFHAAAGMIVYKCGPYNYIYYLRQRYWISRAYAGTRGLGFFAKAVYLVASPLLPLLLLARIAVRVLQKNCHLVKFVLSLPLLAPLMIVYVAGEIVGYLAGPGNALLNVE